MTRLRLRGEFDIGTLPALERELRQAMAANPDLVVDLGEVTFIDAAGLHALAVAADGMRHQGRRLRLDNLRPHVGRLLGLLDLEHLTK